MIDKEKVLQELRETYESTKERLGFSVSFEDYDKEFYLVTAILNKGFVPENFDRALCVIMANDFRDWHGYFNGLLMPNPNYYASQTEAKLFSSEEDKKMLWALVKKTMAISSESSLLNIDANEALMGQFIEKTFKYRVEEFRPKLVEIMTRVKEAWNKE